jgi:RND family efflux transporter MFP subunit
VETTQVHDTSEFKRPQSARVPDTQGEARAAGQPPKRHRRGRYFAGVWILVVAAVALVAWRWQVDRPPAVSAAPAGQAPESAAAEEGAEPVRVDVIKPETHGLGRKSTLPGEVHAFEYAELYAKTSGYLNEQTVDIGDHVERGQLLARIGVPELDEDVKQAEASLERSNSVVTQSEARVETSKAEALAAKAMIEQTEAEVVKAEAQTIWRKSEYDRITNLVVSQSVEKKLEDERRNAWQAARAAELASHAAVDNAKAQANAADARVAQAKADLLHAHADVRVAQAALDKAHVLVDYTRIESPYKGVITARNFHRGAFIRSPDQGGNVPLLVVARTDKMRFVTHVPDLDVPYTNVGDKAMIEIDALPGHIFNGEVSRMSDVEDPLQKVMRVEVDLPNDDNLLREGMYSHKETIELEAPSKALALPSSALVGESIDGKGHVYVVRDGKAHLAQITISQDDGLRMEVTSGLKPTDEVVVRHEGAIADGTPVVVNAGRDAPLAEH